MELVLSDSVDSPRNAIVTGASGGIGEALTQRLRVDDWNVLGTYRSQRVEGAVLLDLNEPEAGLESLLSHLGGEPLHLLVLNAVEGQYAGLARTRPAVVDEYLHAHVGGNRGLIEGLWPNLAAGRGTVVHVSSLAASGGAHTGVAYALAKAMMEGHLQDLQATANDASVRILTVELGMVDTPLLRSVNSKVLARALSTYPLLQPSSVADALVEIATANRSLNGTVIEIGRAHV